ncbi:MAG: NAD(+) synthase [Oscillospiraceae bacterium]|nr:NAD(+) synthase [Oscillospiraceae bacterium]
MKNNLFHCVCATIEGKLGDIRHNTDCIVNEIRSCIDRKIDILTFPEMSLTGYSCGDILYNQRLTAQIHIAAEQIAKSTEGSSIFVVVGAPIRNNGKLMNCAIVFHGGSILGIVPKVQLDNINENDSRHFVAPSFTDDSVIHLCGQAVRCSPRLLFEDPTHGLKIGIVIGNDADNSISVANLLSHRGANLIINPSAAKETVSHYEEIDLLTKSASLQNKCIYMYAASGKTESTTDQVYSGYLAIFENGNCIRKTAPLEITQRICGTVDPEHIHQARAKSCAFDPIVSFADSDFPAALICLQPHGTYQSISCEPFLADLPADTVCRRILELQSQALQKKLQYTNRNKLIIGISGGLDSTVALLACCHAFRKAAIPLENIIGVTMPGPGTSERTHRNALALMKELGITAMEIDINAAVSAHLDNIQHPKALFDITYEQTQSRERTKILMDLANQQNGIVIGTGDLSEIALGWMSYSGDQISMYGINSGIPKTVMRHLGCFLAEHADGNLQSVLRDIMETPVSPELLPLKNDGTQKQETEALVGPYVVHDFFLYYFVKYGYDPEKILRLAGCAFQGVYNSQQLSSWMQLFLKRFFTRQFKRSCFPDGCQVFDMSLSPRNGWRMPSDVFAETFLEI